MIGMCGFRDSDDYKNIVNNPYEKESREMEEWKKNIKRYMTE
jgi:hypothetical protein